MPRMQRTWYKIVASQIYITGKMKEVRESKGWTQQELADLLSVNTDVDISLSYLQKLENQNKPVSPEIALEISRFLRVELKDLVIRK